MRWKLIVTLMCHSTAELRNVCSLLCKMEMSLPRFAAVELFWNGSHLENAGPSWKIRSLHTSGAATSFGEAGGGDEGED